MYKEFKLQNRDLKNIYYSVRKYFKEHNFSDQVLRKYFLSFDEANLHESYNDILNRCLKLRKYKNPSLEQMMLKYGDKLGREKWNIYCERQAYTNSKEYKNMTDDEFKEYNKNRSSTLDNMIKRYGDKLGREKWNIYCERQAYTNSKEYFIEKYGEIDGINKWKNVNFMKSHSYESYYAKDKTTAEEKYKKYIKTKKNYYSKISSEIFSKIYSYLISNNFTYKCYFAPLTKEFGKYNKQNHKYYFYDFVIPELKICIEFNGDAFHANPKFFNSTDKPNPYNKKLTSTDIWKYDQDKLGTLKSLGYNIMIIWEHDYNANNNEIINKAIKYIVEIAKCGVQKYEDW